MQNQPGRMGLRILALGVGVFFLAMSYNKIAWIMEPDLLAQRFQRWLPNASWYARPYLEAVAIPGAAVFARLVPIGEFLTALALIAGAYTNIAAGLALLMIAQFHLATSSYSSVEFLRDGTGPPLFAALIALAIGGGQLPMSIRPFGRR